MSYFILCKGLFGDDRICVFCAAASVVALFILLKMNKNKRRMCMKTKCKNCIYCQEDDISSTRTVFRKGDDIRYWCSLHREMVDPDDSCDDGR